MVSSPTPFLKWAGGKRWLCQRYSAILPTNYKVYIEPFLGSGAVYFFLQPTKALLSDANNRLIECYEQVKLAPNEIHSKLKEYDEHHCPALYYKVRDATFNDPISRSAQLIYLNRTCWNGLYRVNKMGQFNVPIGTKNKVLFPYDNFQSASDQLSNATLLYSDFEYTIDSAGPGAFIFVDPPYTVKHNFNGFLKYNQNIFSWDDQVRLKNALDRAVSRGASFLMTNANHESIVSLYSRYRQIAVDRFSVLSGNPSYRTATKELVVVSW